MVVKVNINGSHHQVEVSSDTDDLRTVRRVAKALWCETVPALGGRRPGGVMGFVTERAPSWDHDQTPPVVARDAG